MKKAAYIYAAMAVLAIVSCEKKNSGGDEPEPTDPYAVTGVTLSQKSAHLDIGDTLILTEIVFPEDASDKTVLWTSDGSGIAKVNQQGMVVAVSSGTAVITVKTNSKGYKAKCFVTVAGAEDPESGIVPPVLPTGKTLYNGVVLPDIWPPRNYTKSDTSPMDCPYLTTSHPAVVPIDFGRQLFVDDFLIANNSGLTRVHHHPVKFNGNPILPLTNSMEKNANHLHGAGPKDGGIIWDPREGAFKMWYEAGWLFKMAYATSANGADWVKPALKSSGLNELSTLSNYQPNSCRVEIDFDTTDEKRYKMFYREPDAKASAYNYGGYIFTSVDGITWTMETKTGPCGDRSTMFYNPFRKKWIYSLRSRGDALDATGSDDRMRYYREADNLSTGANWSNSDKGTSVVFWCRADNKDEQDPNIGLTPQLYNLDAVGYESIMLGMFEILLDENEVAKNAGRPKVTDLKIAYSRDGFHWDRPDRDAFIASSRTLGSWDRGYVQPCGGICSIYGENLVFWYIGFEGNAARAGESAAMHSLMKTGVATMRRDGFCSMEGTGTLTTVPITYKTGKYLFVNADCQSGQLLAEILDDQGNVVTGFEKENCEPMQTNSTIERISWKSGKTLSEFEGKNIRIRFHLTSGKLYSFWVSQATDGRSYGFVAGGGPGFTGNVDNVGLRAYETAIKLYPF